ncbi:MAG: hypothetical protein HYX75_16630 [Acidobacteria bacterium]|nr:hypothetical protein [Acidobacteriota bacterium]
MKKLLVLTVVLLCTTAAVAGTLDDRISAANQNREDRVGSVINLFQDDQFSSAVSSAGLSKGTVEATLRSMPDDELASVAQSANQARNMMSMSVDRSDVNLMLIILIIIAIVAVIAIAAD